MFVSSQMSHCTHYSIRVISQVISSTSVFFHSIFNMSITTILKFTHVQSFVWPTFIKAPNPISYLNYSCDPQFLSYIYISSLEVSITSYSLLQQKHNTTTADVSEQKALCTTRPSNIGSVRFNITFVRLWN